MPRASRRGARTWRYPAKENFSSSPSDFQPPSCLISGHPGGACDAMAKNLMPVDRGQGLLLPLSIDELLPEAHLARFVVEIVDGLDLSAIVSK